MTYRLALGGGVDELLAEVLPVLVVRGLVNDDLLGVVRELVDDVLVLLAQLQVVVGRDALLRDLDSKWRCQYIDARLPDPRRVM